MFESVYPVLKEYIMRGERLSKELSKERMRILNVLIDYIISKKKQNEKVQLNFICTHNSRRSHFGQIWAQTVSTYFNITDIDTYSGGSMATALNPRAVAALERAGFKIESEGTVNPKYSIRFVENHKPIIAWSKIYNDPGNPGKDFCAIMTCSEADEACPVVFGAESRVSLHYLDPKVADGTSAENSIYDERCLQIASEMIFVMKKVANRN